MVPPETMLWPGQKNRLALRPKSLNRKKRIIVFLLLSIQTERSPMEKSENFREVTFSCSLFITVSYTHLPWFLSISCFPVFLCAHERVSSSCFLLQFTTTSCARFAKFRSFHETKPPGKEASLPCSAVYRSFSYSVYRAWRKKSSKPPKLWRSRRRNSITVAASFLSLIHISFKDLRLHLPYRSWHSGFPYPWTSYRLCRCIPCF